MMGLSFITDNARGEISPGEITVIADSTTKWGKPTDLVQFKLTYTNKDDTQDGYLDNFTVSWNPAQGDWDATVHAGASRPIVPDNNNDNSINISVSVGETALYKTYREITVSCDVEDVSGNVKVAGLSITVTVYADQNFELSLTGKSGDPTSKKPQSDGSVEFNMTVNNTGNGKDKITFSSVGSPGDTPIFTPSTGVDAFDTADYTMTVVNIPDDISSGTHVVTVTVTSQDTETTSAFSLAKSKMFPIS